MNQEDYLSEFFNIYTNWRMFRESCNDSEFETFENLAAEAASNVVAFEVFDERLQLEFNGEV
jgi:hypothetical protein